MAATSAALSPVTAKPGRTMPACWANSRTAAAADTASGSASRGTSSGSGQGQPGLADSAGAGQRHQPHPGPGDGRAQALQVVIPPDQRRGRHGQARLGAQALQRREIRPRARPGQLVDALRRADVLQPVELQVPDRRPVRQRARQLERRLGQHHLAAVRGRGDPRRPVHVHTDVVILVRDRLPGMQAHPDPHGVPVRPVMPGQGALRRQGAGHRIAREREHHEEAVTLGGDLPAMSGRERRAQQGAMVRQMLAVCRPR
jgi:hypothetical protein